MVNILNSIYQANNYKPNSMQFELTVTLDGDIETSEINNYLPNNGSKFRQTKEIGYLTTGSSATLYSPSFMYVCNFIAENGAVNSVTGYQEGIWKCLAKITFK